MLESLEADAMDRWNRAAIRGKRQRNAEDDVVVVPLYVLASAGVSVPVRCLEKSRQGCEAARKRSWRSTRMPPRRDGLLLWVIALGGKVSWYRIQMSS